MTRLLLRLAFLSLMGAIGAFSASAQEGPDAKAKQISDLEKQIAEIQKKIADLKTAPAAAKKALSFADATKWRAIRGAAISPDGNWIVHRVGAQEGDSEVILRNTKTDKEIKFSGGGGPLPTPLEFTADSKWFATVVSPAPSRGLSFGPRPVVKVVLVNLGTGDKTELEGYRSFSFNRDASTHVVLRKAPTEAPATPTGPASPPTGPSAPAAPAATGVDIVIRELATGNELTLGNVGTASFNKKGNLLALTIDSAGQIGNGVQVRDLKTGALVALDSAKATYQSLNWHESADAFVVLRGVDEKGVEGKVYTILGFTDVGTTNTKTVFDAKTDAAFPKGEGISGNRGVSWSDDLSMISFGIAEQKAPVEAKKEAAEPKKEGPPAGPRPTTGPGAGSARPDMVIWHWKDDRLQPQQQVQAAIDRTISSLCVFRVKEKKFIRVGQVGARATTLTGKQKYGITFDSKPYDLMADLDGKRFQDVYVVDLTNGERKKALTKVRWFFGSSPTGTHALYYDDGKFHTLDLATLKSTTISTKAGTSFIDTEDDHNIDRPPTRPLGWSVDGKFVLLSDNWDIWQLAVNGESAVNLTVDGKSKGIRYRDRVVFDIEEKGIDLSKPMVVAMMEERTKKSGYVQIAPKKPGAEVLLADDASISRLTKAKSADIYSYTRETTKDPQDLYVVDGTFKNAKKVSTVNPQQSGYLWSAGARLVDYVGVGGQKLQGALYLPADYQPGKKYPTIVYIYEQLSDELHRYVPPSTGGFNRSIYTSNGYAVFTPDIKYQLNDPGISSVKCVLPALDAAIATGIVDGDRIGLQGHSWGGYQTAFLITQTDRFKAAVAGAALTDLVSMYSSVYWNAGIANQQIFESSQGRFTGGYWEQQEAYIRNSPVYHATKVKTPLLLLHNDKDGAVDFTQGIEYFNTLRRLQKPVVMLQYKGENHGLVKPENRRDYSVRMKEFFDHHLMGKAAPDWWTTGVPHLKLDDHLKGRKE